MITIGIVTVSDKGSVGKRDDLSGPEIRTWAEKHGYSIKKETIVPDEQEEIMRVLIDYSDDGLDLVLTTGGTGFTSRDVTPEATKAVIEKEAPGFAEIMRARSFEITPHAMLSRAVSGIRDKTLIINLPGSPKAVRENLGFIEQALPHAAELLRGTAGDCAKKE